MCHTQKDIAAEVAECSSLHTQCAMVRGRRLRYVCMFTLGILMQLSSAGCSFLLSSGVSRGRNHS